MKKKEFVIDNEEFKKLYDDMIKVCQSNIDYVESSIRYYEKVRKMGYEQEPSKRNKKKYKRWEENIKLLDNHIFKLYRDIELSVNTYIQLSNYKK